MSADPAANLRKLLESQAIPAEAPSDAPCFTPTLIENHPFGDPILEHLIMAFLVWEAGEKKASPAPAKLVGQCVDANDLRICLPAEIVDILGTSYPKASERADRIRATLNDIFEREHDVTLAHLANLGKREARQYLDSLQGIPPYVAARTALLANDAHAFPLDERLLKLLLAERCLPDDSTLADAQGWIERQLRAGEAKQMFLALEAWATDRKPPAKNASKKSSTRTSKKAASKKRSSKKSPASSDG